MKICGGPYCTIVWCVSELIHRLRQAQYLAQSGSMIILMDMFICIEFSSWSPCPDQSGSAILIEIYEDVCNMFFSSAHMNQLIVFMVGADADATEALIYNQCSWYAIFSTSWHSTTLSQSITVYRHILKINQNIPTVNHMKVENRLPTIELQHFLAGRTT